MTESTADVFAAYLGMTEENATWAYSVPEIRGRCGQTMPTYQFTATSPLAPDPTPGWLEALVRHRDFYKLDGRFDGEFTAWWGSLRRYECGEHGAHPTHAVALALVAADPALRARLEACGDWEGVK